jgi:putative hydrolase of the HAD superfamily
MRIKYILFDMYGVIIEESKGNFIPYTYEFFNKSEHDRIRDLLKKERLFDKAGLGEITSEEFLTKLGYSDTEKHMKNYIENYLTFDEQFRIFADAHSNKYEYALVSNDVSAWSQYITQYHHLNHYFKEKVISADIHCKKPDEQIFKIALMRLKAQGDECIFIDNSIDNIKTAECLGMKTILFNRDHLTYSGLQVNNFTEITDLIKYMEE